MKIGIVGSGNVGTTFAYALLLSGLASEIVLIDSDIKKAEGEAMDLNHAVPLTHPTRIAAGDFTLLSGCSVTVITAGSAQHEGETRLELNKRNAVLLKSIVPEIARHNQDGILVVATNPVDVMTHAAWSYSGFAPGRVLGSGTILDTSRFRHLLSRHFGVDPKSVHAFIIGEHGDSEVPVWSLANIAGMPLDVFAKKRGVQYSEEVKKSLFDQTRRAAYEIIRRKGATYYAVAMGLLRIVEAILRDQKTVYSVSSLIQDYYGIRRTFLSLPAVIGRGGIEYILQLQLDQTETAAIQSSARILQAAAQDISLP